MNKQQIDLDSMWHDVQAKCLKLKVLMAGKTGVGKSSVINAIIGKEISKVSNDGKPCTKANQELIWSADTADLIIVDVPGFGEANSPIINGVDYIENIKELARNAHILLLVLKCEDRALELEEKFLLDWKNDAYLNPIPVLIVINQIDKAKPSRIWEPDKINLKQPTSQKELNISGFIDYVSSIPAFSEFAYSNKIIPISAGEYVGDSTYGIDCLRKGVNDEIPDIFRMVIEHESISRDEKANKIINYYAIATGAAAIEPIPIVDSFLIAPIQLAMIIQLGRIYGVDITKSVAGGLVQALGLSLAGNYLFLILVGFFPGVKQVLGPAIAYSLTYTSGLIIKELFLTKNLSPSKEQLTELAEKYKLEAKEAKRRYSRAC